MSGLVLELQADALNRSVSCSDLLRKALVVSRKLSIGAIEGWLRNELNGYSLDNDEVPIYREIHGQIKVWNPYHGWQPLNFGDPKEAEILSKRKIMQPIGELDSLLDDKEGGALQVPFSQNIVNSLMKGMAVPLQPTLHVSRTEIVGILDTARNTVLDWALELEKEGVIGEGMTFSKEEQQAADQVTYQITNNIGSMQNSQLQQDSSGALQNLEVETDLEQVIGFINRLKDNTEQLYLNPDSVDELKTEISTIEIQSGSPKPKMSIISEALRSIRTILEGATGNVTASSFLEHISSLF